MEIRWRARSSGTSRLER